MLDKDDFWWTCPSCKEDNVSKIEEAEMFTQSCAYCEGEFCIDFSVTTHVNEVITVEEMDRRRELKREKEAKEKDNEEANEKAPGN